jgi:ATP-dependent Clp protease ATP-binding subunit ClpA
MFTPEFRNRLDATISFASLDHEVILRVVDKFLLELEAQLHEKKVDPTFSPKLREFLARKGFDPQMGARPMSRLIQDTIRKALADELLFGRLTGGGKVTIDLDADDRVKLRFDMSEYMERHAVSRLIGAPPGYVGFDQGGQLTEGITKHPYSVLLLDEIEKAHPDIFNILLQVMDHGTLTDNNGRKADFRNVIIIMTTNAGAGELARQTIGFATEKQAGDEMAEIKRLFTPEFRNRLDATISFAALDHDVILRVVDKFLLELEAQLHEKKVDPTFSPKLREFLARKGFDPQMGARPMSRLIQDTIRKALADELLFGRLVSGGKVSIDLDDDDEVQLGFEEPAAPAPKEAEPA